MKLSAAKRLQATRRILDGEPVARIADDMKVTRWTIYRIALNLAHPLTNGRPRKAAANA